MSKFSIFRHAALAGLLGFEILTMISSLQGQEAPANTVSVAEKSLKLFLQVLDDEKSTRYVAAFSDLNGDGTLEAIVYLISNGWCGSGGCNTLVLTPAGDSWKVVGNIAITRPPIRVLASSSHGWRSLGVWVQGGGIQPGYEAELPFDGKTYPRNPTVPPARRLDGKPAGQIAIGSSQNPSLLYDRQASPVLPAAPPAPPRSQPSFDCLKASTATEKLICRDAALASMDIAMAAAYRTALQNLAGEQKDSLRRDQIQWLAQYLAACNSVASDEQRKECVAKYLSAHTEELRAKAH